MDFPNIGYFIIPFCVKEENIESLHFFESNKLFERKNNYLSCNYIFKHIMNLVNENTTRIYDINVDSVLGDEKNINNFYSIGSALIENMKILMFTDYIGYLIIRINYLSMCVDQIENFVYHFKRYTELDPKTHTNKKGLLYKIVNTVLPGEKFIPFFCTEKDDFKSCNVFQLVKIKPDEYIDADNSKSERNYSKHLFSLGRSYKPNFNYDGKALKESESDAHYSPMVYCDWCGSPSTMSCIINLNNVDIDDKSFLEGAFYKNFQNDYFFMYLILINQRFTTLYLLSKLTQNKVDLDIVEEQLCDFRTKYSFKSVSNEMTYQNLYNKMMLALDIDSLISDVEDASERLKMEARQEDEKRERKTNRILTALAVLAIGSALVDIKDYLNFLIPEGWAFGISLGVVVVSLIVGLILSKKKKRKKK